MKHEYIIRENHPCLLLFFAGWAADATPFRTYRPEGHDFLLCYDYRTLEADFLPLRTYQEINVVGWSMGVWAASHVMPCLDTPIGRSIALNGTPFPVDPQLGIPPAIWQGTLDGLSPANLHKFCRRMCADTEAFHRFLRVSPHRPVEELAEEMRAIGQQLEACPAAPAGHWTEAVAGCQDRIVPPPNQQRAWETWGVPLRLTDDAHYSEKMFQEYLQDTWKKNK